MSDKSWFILYIVIFFSIFIPSILFLFSRDASDSASHAVTIVSFNPEHGHHFYPTQVIPSDPTKCINDLFNQFQTGNLDPDTFRDGINKCFGLNSNNSQIVPQPQPPTTSTPRFV